MSKIDVYQHLFFDDTPFLRKIKMNIKYRLFDIPYFHKLKLDSSRKILCTQQRKVSTFSPSLSDLEDDDSNTSFFKRRSLHMKNDNSTYEELRNKYKRNKAPLELKYWHNKRVYSMKDIPHQYLYPNMLETLGIVKRKDDHPIHSPKLEASLSSNKYASLALQALSLSSPTQISVKSEDVTTTSSISNPKKDEQLRKKEDSPPSFDQTVTASNKKISKSFQSLEDA